MKILILGVNGFIGSNLTEFLIKETNWEIFGMDLGSDKIHPFLGNKNFTFLEGDITINQEWIEYHVRKCDVVLPLVAIATPLTYVKDPLRVFELDFEANLRVLRACVKYGTRVIFPSTSEVYGMCEDDEFNEETSNLVLGPISKQRWIYSASKQLMDRVIHAYGLEGRLQYTLIRPFNWVGPKLDSLQAAKEGSSRVVVQFLGNILNKEDIVLVDGGNQRRCFLYIDDALEALKLILDNKDSLADGQIFNIGSPDSEISIHELAKLMIKIVSVYPGFEDIDKKVNIISKDHKDFYGEGYQDINRRVPSIKAINSKFGWEPKVDLNKALEKTIEYFISEFNSSNGDI